MTLVLDRATAGPGTHALVVGVSSYPYLDAKPPNLSPIARGLKSLRSPATSARAFATWLAEEYDNREAPIATIDLLLSDDRNQGFALEGGRRSPIENADLPAVIEAAVEWKRRGDADPDGVMVFYFCGHGMTAGFRNALLARDAGRIASRPMRGAFDPDRLLAGMKNCGAAKQVYLLDACRAANADLFRAFNEETDGLVPIQGDANPAIAQAVFHSTRHGAPAYGRTDGDVSLFTGMMLQALNGLAANERDESWRINTSDIHSALSHLSTRLCDPSLGDVQSPAPGTGASFDFHYLDGAPRVPFYLVPDWHEGAAPPPDVERVRISNRAGVSSSWATPWRADDATRWSWAPNRFKGEAVAGEIYASEVEMTDGRRRTGRDWYLSPPYRTIKVD